MYDKGITRGGYFRRLWNAFYRKKMLHLYNIKHTGMKTRSLFIGMLLLLVLMGACNSGSVMTQATGFAYEVVVVMDQKDWKGPAGEAIKSELASSVPGLPQAEPSLKITYVQPKDFTGLLRYVRNILVVTIDPTAYTKVSVGYENNVWARGTGGCFAESS